MTPVDPTKMVCGAQLGAVAASFAISLAACMPSAGTGVGVSAIDEEGAADALLEVQTIENDRRCYDLILREDSGYRTLRSDTSSARSSCFFFLFDAAVDSSGSKTDGR